MFMFKGCAEVERMSLIFSAAEFVLLRSYVAMAMRLGFS